MKTILGAGSGFGCGYAAVGVLVALAAGRPERFNPLPKSPPTDVLREYSVDVSGRATQCGVGAWLTQLFAPVGVTGRERYGGRDLAVPSGGNDVRATESQVSRTPTNSTAFPVNGPAAGLYEIFRVQGWEVHVSRRLEADDAKALDRALALIEGQLRTIAERVPAPAVARLREVPLWVSPEYPGIAPKAEYHPDAGWLQEHGRDPAMAKAVEFTNVRIFEAECRRMPVLVLHELAHAYHDRVLGHDHAGIRAAYDHARAGGKYDRVERRDSEGRRSFDRAYALTNPEEYFAESTEAYFGVNDFFPFNREELKGHDPEMFELLTQVWNSGRAPE